MALKPTVGAAVTGKLDSMCIVKVTELICVEKFRDVEQASCRLIGKFFDFAENVDLDDEYIKKTFYERDKAAMNTLLMYVNKIGGISDNTTRAGRGSVTINRVLSLLRMCFWLFLAVPLATLAGIIFLFLAVFTLITCGAFVEPNNLQLLEPKTYVRDISDEVKKDSSS